MSVYCFSFTVRQRFPQPSESSYSYAWRVWDSDAPSGYINGLPLDGFSYFLFEDFSKVEKFKFN